MKIKHTLNFLVLLLFVFLFSNCLVMAASFPPLPEALAALESDEEVTVLTVTVDEWEENSNFYYAFEPLEKESTLGFILYPGGGVDPAAYAPFARAIAAAGYLTVIAKMPNDLAIAAAGRATAIMGDYDAIETWVIGGHSLGGVASCAYAQENSEKVNGVVLWASFPSDIFRIDDKDLAVISIYGTNDALVDSNEIEESRQHLPPDTQFEPVEGGNHTQFGWYDTSPGSLQPGDKPADITREEQQDEIVQLTVAFLSSWEAHTCPATYLLGKEHPGLHSARHLRDNVLAHMVGGKQLISLYYQNGKSIVELFEKNPTVKKSAKKVLESLLTGN